MEACNKKIVGQIGEENFAAVKEKLIAGLKTNPKEGETRSVNIEIKGDAQPDGVSFEILNVRENNFAEFIPSPTDYMKDALSVVSLSIKAKDAASVEVIKQTFEGMKPMILEMPLVKKYAEKATVNFRADGTNVAIDVVTKDEKVSGIIKEIGLKLSEFYSFSLALKTGFKFGGFFEAEPEAIFAKIAELYFGIKGESKNLSYIIKTLNDAVNVIDLNKIEKDKTKKKIKKIKKYLKFGLAFAKASVVLEYNQKETKEAALELLLKKKEDFEGFKAMLLGMGGEMVKPFLEGMNLLPAAQALDVDDIKISAINPEEKAGIAVHIKLPEFSELFRTKFLA